MTRNSRPSANDGLAVLSRQVRYRLIPLFDSTLDLIFPPHCVSCQKPGTVWCRDCQKNVQPSVSPEPEAHSPLSGRLATAAFSGSLRDAIHALKYNGKRRLAIPLSERLVLTLQHSGWQPTLITAVPLHSERVQMRGYNQAALLAERTAGVLGIAFDPHVVQRVHSTRPQVGLNYQERQSNMAGAFAAIPERAVGQTIVVIDDVYTTGATLRACAEALHTAGAEQIWALTVASAEHSKFDKADRQPIDI